jgi:hypothetical protein
MSKTQSQSTVSHQNTNREAGTLLLIVVLILFLAYAVGNQFGNDLPNKTVAQQQMLEKHPECEGNTHVETVSRTVAPGPYAALVYEDFLVCDLVDTRIKFQDN